LPASVHHLLSLDHSKARAQWPSREGATAEGVSEVVGIKRNLEFAFLAIWAIAGIGLGDAPGGNGTIMVIWRDG
jgi:hypothetical protein